MGRFGRDGRSMAIAFLATIVAAQALPTSVLVETKHAVGGIGKSEGKNCDIALDLISNQILSFYSSFIFFYFSCYQSLFNTKSIPLKYTLFD